MGKMTIRNCMDAAYQLLNQYSIVGTVVPLSYNDQADNENRMINLINDAQMEIAKTVKPISAMHTIVVPKPERNERPKALEFEMPEDFNHAIAIYFTPEFGGLTQTIDAGMYKWVDTTLILPNIPGTYRIEYSRWPHRYDANVDKNTELDNTPDTHEAIPYFVAAMIAIDENSKAYYALYNVWETRLSRLGAKPAHAVSTQVLDVYGFDRFGGLW